MGFWNEVGNGIRRVLPYVLTRTIVDGKEMDIGEIMVINDVVKRIEDVEKGKEKDRDGKT